MSMDTTALQAAVFHLSSWDMKLPGWSQQWAMAWPMFVQATGSHSIPPFTAANAPFAGEEKLIYATGDRSWASPVVTTGEREHSRNTSSYPLESRIENLSFVEAAMLEAVSVALHAVSLTRVSSTDSVLVIGAGMIGLLILQALRAAGVSQIMVIDVERSRLTLAKELGVAETVHGKDADVLSEIARFAGAGIDAAIEAVGLDDTVRLAINAVRKGGRVTLVGNISPTVMLRLQSVVTRQIRLQGSCASAGEYPRAIDLLASGTIRVKPLISAVAPLERGRAGSSVCIRGNLT